MSEDTKAMPPFRAWVAVHQGTRPYEGGFSTIDAEDAKWGFLNDPNVYWSSWELAEANGWRVVEVEVRPITKLDYHGVEVELERTPRSGE